MFRGLPDGMEWLGAFLGSNDKVFICIPQYQFGAEAGISISAHASALLEDGCQRAFSTSPGLCGISCAFSSTHISVVGIKITLFKFR
jgi:hypothetical protein